MSAARKTQVLIHFCAPVVFGMILGSTRLAMLYGRSPTKFVILTQIEQGLFVLLRETRFSRAESKLWKTNYNTYEGTTSTSRPTEAAKTAAHTKPGYADDEEPLTETDLWAIRRQIDTDIFYEPRPVTQDRDGDELGP
ncbi:hypothetical protein LTR02_016442 [Friedmanniomyces endolithicus]|nr:hypothetical protein LTR94_018522 [Friedmanniomyces endolithicus]KAK0771993.1 hypothetical protein LTR59_015863 [Friedmanniomyces endolithicus]KAK0778311.1 hypothetical protein LTR38_014835 [Friedmanniomyces endolithicus]KAK0834145.1 hypothetical protein LTR03_014566 [Friedmanniomyces endolithicus]KAK0888300.1 hypothetical protein LTR02_016442 [Friedmanniomyces endolithicus]